MSDICAPEIRIWQGIETVARRVFRLYGFEEVRTPIIERIEVFTRALGEGTDVVQKEMYAFEDRGGRAIALRPEGTAGVIRFICGGGQEWQDARVYYLGPMFRAERPQAGRKRQFHQVGVEAIGAPSPAADVECIALQVHLLREWGLEGFQVHLHTRGMSEDQPAVRAGLQAALRPRIGELCDDCRRRLETHPLRVLDCKQPGCGAIVEALPPVTTFMGEPSRAYLAEVVRLLGRLAIPASVNPRLVRGLDYYVHTIWEITHPALGAQDALAGGGRYRVEMAHKAIEGVGFAMGLERLVVALRNSGRLPAQETALAVWLVSAGDRAREENLALAQTLRARGVAAGMDVAGRSMKAQMRAANRAAAPWVIIRGDDELAAGVAVLKNMKDGREERVPVEDLPQRMGRAAD